MSYACVWCTDPVEKRTKLHRLLPVCAPCRVALEAVAICTDRSLKNAAALLEQLKEQEEKMRLRRRSQGVSFSGVGLYKKFRWYATELGPASNLTANAWHEYTTVVTRAR